MIVVLALPGHAMLGLPMDAVAVQDPQEGQLVLVDPDGKFEVAWTFFVDAGDDNVTEAPAESAQGLPPPSTARSCC